MQEMGPTWIERKVLRISGLAGRARLHRRSRPDLCAKNQQSINPIMKVYSLAEKSAVFLRDSCQILDFQSPVITPTAESQAKKFNLYRANAEFDSPYNESQRSETLLIPIMSKMRKTRLYWVAAKWKTFTSYSARTQSLRRGYFTCFYERVHS